LWSRLCEAIEERLRINSQLTRERIAANGRLQAQQALFVEQARALGRIGLYLETSQDAHPEGGLGKRLEDLAAQ